MEGDWKWRCFLETETLDCPICTEPLSRPVYQCENGHPICSACSTKVNSKGCPSCFRPTGRIRCLAVEKILDSLLVPCKHGPHGCQKMLQYNKRAERDDHEKRACQFQPFPCPLASCSHQGPFAAFSSHLTDAHGVKRNEFYLGYRDPWVRFRMSSQEDCMFLGEPRKTGTAADATAVGVLVLVHRENEDELGDWFFCSAYGAEVKYKLQVERAEGRSDSAVHKMKATTPNSSRASVREASEFVDRLLVPRRSTGWWPLRHFDVRVTITGVGMNDSVRISSLQPISFSDEIVPVTNPNLPRSLSDLLAIDLALGEE